MLAGPKPCHQVVSYPQGIGDYRQGGVDRAAGHEEAPIDDVEIIYFMGSAVYI